LFQPNLLAAEKIRIAATTTVLGSITGEIMGNQAEIHTVAAPKRDIHFYHPTPKDVLKVKKADVLVHGGLDLEAWRDPLLIAAGNKAFLGEGKASIDVSRGISLLEVPVSISRAEGDIHLYGNPHYWLDPENAKIMAKNISDGLGRIVPERAAEFRSRAEAFNRKIDERTKDWKKRMEPYRGTAVVTYHKSWPYFAERFGLVVVGQLEPKPGIPPTAKHLAELVRLMKERGVKLIIKESFHEKRTPEKISKETGAAVVTLLQSVGETEDARDYISMMEHNIRTFVGAGLPRPLVGRGDRAPTSTARSKDE